jgi:hypothetical protein
MTNAQIFMPNNAMASTLNKAYLRPGARSMNDLQYAICNALGEIRGAF